MGALRTFDIVIPGRGLVLRAGGLLVVAGDLPMVAHHDGEALHRLELRGRRERSKTARPRCPLERTLLDELRRCFGGERVAFSVPLADVAATAFQRAVWDSLRGIPYGETRSYGEIACAIGKPGAARAVGRACGANPWPIIVPCHRVVGADGGLGGYSAGVRWKRVLLAVEGAR